MKRLMNPRVQSVACFAMAISLAGSAQGPAWEMLQPDASNTTLAMDALELEDAFIILTSSFNADLSASSATLQKVDKEDGALLASLPLSTPDTYLFSSAMLRDPETGYIHVFGGIGTATGIWGIGHQVVDTDLVVQGTFEYALNGLRDVFFDNIRLLSNGKVVLAGGAQDQASDLSHLLVCKVDMTGSLLASYSRTRQPIPFARDVIEIAPDTVLVGSIAGVNEDPSNPRGWYTRFDGDLEPFSEFQAVPYDGSSPNLNADKTIWDAMRMVPLPGGNIIISGKTGPPGPLRAAIHKLDPEGNPLAWFAPMSAFIRDFPASPGSSDMTDDGNVLFAKMASSNMGVPSLWSPLDPNQAHIYKLDTMLNLQCSYLLDGFPDERYYWVSRVLSTTDGGYLLLGGMRDLSQLPDPMQGWVRKFTALDCLTGVQDNYLHSEASVFPNPGNGSFMITLNGPMIPLATLVLYDALGKQVATQTLLHSQGMVDTSQLAPGIHLYVVRDANGQELARGRWMKE